MYRTIDANINRICEGLRIIEDILRFEISDRNNQLSGIISNLKEIRHYLRKNINIQNKINHRNSTNDIGKKYNKIENNRKSINDLVKANFYRVQEGLRVLEESFKLEKKLNNYINKIKSFRFETYSLEKKIFIIIEKIKINLSKYMSIDVTEIPINRIKKISQNIFNSDITSIELKNQSLDINEFFKKINIFQNILNKKDIPIIIKDRIELAIFSDCDGINIDRTNIPVEIIKKSYNKTIGYTIKSPDELNEINFNNIDYIIIDNFKKIPIKYNKIVHKFECCVKKYNYNFQKYFKDISEIEYFSIYSNK